MCQLETVDFAEIQRVSFPQSYNLSLYEKKKKSGTEAELLLSSISLSISLDAENFQPHDGSNSYSGASAETYSPT